MAATTLAALVDAGHEVELVVTRPDRRRGRGPAMSPSPVNETASRLGIPVAFDLDALVALATPPGSVLGVVVAYGRIVPARVLARVPMLNVHFSLLPRWRGAAPVERALLAGDETTGVSIMALEPELDTGPLYAAEAVRIEPNEHVGALRARLADLGARLLLSVLEGPLPEPVPQVGEATYAAKLEPGELELDWSRPADELARVVRLDRAWTTWQGRRLRVLEADVVAGDDSMQPAPPGTVVGDVVVTGTGAVRLVRVQPEGRAAMEAAAWLRGARPVAGARLGTS